MCGVASSTRPLAVLALVAISLIPAAAEDDAGPHPDYQKIKECIGTGGEVVLSLDSVGCTAYGSGKFHVPANAAYTIAAAEVCANPQDRRQLPADIIKRLAEKTDGKDAYKPSGIRILGAVFCTQLDLVGLDLSSGLTLDRALFAKGINARWFRTRGDLSLDQSIILQNL